MDPRTEQMLSERRAAEEAVAALPRGQRVRVKAVALLWRHRRRAFAALAIVSGILLANYLLVTLPARARDRRLAATREAGLQNAQQRLDQSVKLDACLADAQSVYVTNWDASCRALRRRQSCTLPSDQAYQHETTLRLTREDCFKRHLGAADDTNSQSR